jgi:hypothetical protein
MTKKKGIICLFLETLTQLHGSHQRNCMTKKKGIICMTKKTVQMEMRGIEPG